MVRLRIALHWVSLLGNNVINIVLNTNPTQKPKPQTTHELSEMQKIERVELNQVVRIVRV